MAILGALPHKIKYLKHLFCILLKYGYRSYMATPCAKQDACSPRIGPPGQPQRTEGMMQRGPYATPFKVLHRLQAPMMLVKVER